MLLVVGRVGDAVQMTSDGRLRLICLRPNNSVQSLAAFSDIRVTSKEIHRARAETEQLRHPGIVVVLLRQMAVGTILGRADAARRVGEVRIERLTAVTFRRKSLLLRIDPLTIRVL